MVAIRVLTLRPRDRSFFWMYSIATMFALGISWFSLKQWPTALHNPNGRLRRTAAATLAFAA
jgi:hypothetical protein